MCSVHCVQVHVHIQCPCSPSLPYPMVLHEYECVTICFGMVRYNNVDLRAQLALLHTFVISLFDFEFDLVAELTSFTQTHQFNGHHSHAGSTYHLQQ